MKNLKASGFNQSDHLRAKSPTSWTNKIATSMTNKRWATRKKAQRLVEVAVSGTPD